MFFKYDIASILLSFVHVATDNHVGYLEKDQIRGTDSLEAFEEVLRIAQERQASSTLFAQCY